MGPRICAEAKSCRWRLDKCTLPENLFCSPCRELKSMSIHFLRDNPATWKGKCRRLREEIVSEHLDEPRPKQARRDPNHFDVRPANNAHMNFQRYSSESDWNLRNKQRVLAEIKCYLKDEDIDRAIAGPYTVGGGGDSVNLPKGGKSKAAISKQGNSIGSVVNGMIKQMCKVNQGKATPHRIRDMSFNYSQKLRATLAYTPKTTTTRKHDKSFGCVFDEAYWHLTLFSFQSIQCKKVPLSDSNRRE